MRTPHSVIFGVFVRQAPIVLAFCPNFLACNTPVRQLTEALTVTTDCTSSRRTISQNRSTRIAIASMKQPKILLLEHTISKN
jgi:hypothetical protein